MRKINVFFFGSDKNAIYIINYLRLIKEIKVCAILTKNTELSFIKKLKSMGKFILHGPINKENTKYILNFLKLHNIDISIVFSYGQKISEKILNKPRFGSINIHYSNLPKLRGPSPVQTAILKGIKTTGISIIKMNKEIDKGEIIYNKKINIFGKNIDELFYYLNKKTIKFIKPVLLNYISNKIKTKRQNGIPSKTKIIKKSDGLIIFKHNSIKNIIQKYKAYKSWPGIYASIDKIFIKFYDPIGVFYNQKVNKGTILKINSKGIYISCKNGYIIFKKIQISGKRIFNTIDMNNNNYLKGIIGKVI